MVQSILVPLDGSAFGEQALPFAISLAKRAKANLQLLHVHSPLQATYAEIQLYDATLEQHLLERERAYLEEVGRRVVEASGLPVSTFNKEGEIADVIEAHVAANRNDLVVLSTHARGAMGRFWLGSVADELIHDSPVPLVLVHPTETVLEFTHDVPLKRILVPLDGTPLAEQIFDTVMPLAKMLGAEVTLLRILSPVMMATLPMGLGTVSAVAQTMADQVEKLHTQLKTECQTYLNGVAGRLREQGLSVETHVAIDDQAGVGVIHYVQSAKFDLIAMETHGRSGLGRLFLGSTSTRVLRGTTIPMLLKRG